MNQVVPSLDGGSLEITLPFNIFKDFNHADWKRRFAAVEKTTLVFRKPDYVNTK